MDSAVFYWEKKKNRRWIWRWELILDGKTGEISMRIQKIVDLKGGEILAKTVMTPDYKILLSEGTKLRKDYIEKLGELGIREVFVEDEISTHEVKI